MVSTQIRISIFCTVIEDQPQSPSGRYTNLRVETTLRQIHTQGVTCSNPVSPTTTSGTKMPDITRLSHCFFSPIQQFVQQHQHTVGYTVITYRHPALPRRIQRQSHPFNCGPTLLVSYFQGRVGHTGLQPISCSLQAVWPTQPCILPYTALALSFDNPPSGCQILGQWKSVPVVCRAAVPVMVAVASPSQPSN